MHILKNFSILLFSLVITCQVFASQKQDYKLWYTKPANIWSAEALPIGNGRMGAMLYGGVNQDKIQFNEQSLWSGDNNWDGEYETGDHGFGSYRNFGEITIDFSHTGEATQYIRSLEISKGIHTTQYKVRGINYTREAFASYPDQVMVFQYKTNKKGGLSCKISMNSAQGAISKANGNGLSFYGEMPNKLKYAASLKVSHEGGKVNCKDGYLIVENCNSFTLYLDARTDYKPDFYSNWRGTEPMPVIEKELAAAMSKPYKTLFQNHVADLSSLLGRVKLDMGTSNDSLLALPTDMRLKFYSGAEGAVQKSEGHHVDANAFNGVILTHKGTNDPDLEELMFFYGRYLLASSSRPGGLPANLQGLWNDSNTPAWASDYHSNINLQMNYWSAESTNLSECAVPLIDFIDKCRPSSRIATKKAFGENTRGWTARTSQIASRKCPTEP